MIGDKISLQPHHLLPASAIVNTILPELSDGYTIAIAGESGCGKSTLALALQSCLIEKGYKSFVFHMDDYFHLPPTSNHNNRLLTLNNVGPHEVNLTLLQEHILEAKLRPHALKKPLVFYQENEIKEEEVDFSEINIIIVEGTYTMLLEVDKRVFINRTYKDTVQNRIERARDPLSPFVEQVLEIEHKIISSQISKANIIVDANYEIKFC